MRASLSTAAVTALSLVPSALALSVKVPRATPPDVEKADQVKAAFQFAWDGYYKYAFPDDELHPVSNTGGNSRYVYSIGEIWLRKLTGCRGMT
jgi:mannosyl-oligosaccharide alpha-1,2-mannosidase